MLHGLYVWIGGEIGKIVVPPWLC